MFAFRLDTPSEVDAFYTKALALGGTCEGAPGERGPKMYFSYFRDLDGNKLCAFCMADKCTAASANHLVRCSMRLYRSMASQSNGVKLHRVVPSTWTRKVANAWS